MRQLAVREDVRMMARSAGKRSKSVLLRVLIVAFCIYLGISVIGLYGELVKGKEELDAVLKENEQKNAEIAELKNLLENMTMEELVEHTARNKLGYAYPNEQVYIDASGN